MGKIIANIQQKVQTEIECVFHAIRETSEENYYLLLAKAEDTSKDERLDVGLAFESNLDERVDQTRFNFCMQYLNSMYRKDNSDYSGDCGLARLNIELFIYMQIWESLPFLKLLYRMAHAIEEYPWQVDVPDGKYHFIINDVCRSLEKRGFGMAQIIRNSYSSYLRNTVAHSLYYIVEGTREIMLYDKNSIKKGTKRIMPLLSFQNKFLQSCCLSFQLFNYLENSRLNYAKELCGNPIKIHLPNGNEIEATARLQGERTCFIQIK